ncbi:MarR family winged helix-turn-helix transcriptional regulator [Streptomyces sp. NPDC054841]
MPIPARTSPSLLYAVKRLELVIRAELDEMLRGSGVTTLQYTALTVLEHRDGVTAAQLARDSFVTPQSMADMLRLMEGRGLIRRAPNPQNRREVLVHLADEGRSFLARYAGPATAVEERLISPLTGEDADTVRRALSQMWAALRTPEAASEEAGRSR